MSGYILCRTERARNPYYIENISTNIYSIEELCYYLCNNLYLIDQTILNPELCSWIENELKRNTLAVKVRQNIGKFADLRDVIYPIVKEINYLSYEELKVLNAKINVMNEQSRDEREKEKGDTFMDNGMYVRAINVYQTLLKRLDDAVSVKGLKARVLNNLGCAYTRLFQMEKAMDCFYNAWVISNEDQDAVSYLLALKAAGKDEILQEFLKKDSVENYERIHRLLEERLSRNISEDIESEVRDPDQKIDQLIKEYHRSTGS